MTRAPLSGADLYDWMALRRVSDGAVARLGEWWLDGGHRMPGFVTDALAELCRRELVVLGGPDPTAGGMARATLTDAGTVRYEQLGRQRQTALQASALQLGANCVRLAADSPVPQHCRWSFSLRPGTSDLRRHCTSAELWVPDPHFPIKTPAGRRSSGPAQQAAPGGQPDPSSGAKGSGIEQLRWAHSPDETSLHLLAPGDVLLAAADGPAQTLCGRRVPADGLTIGSCVSGALCMTCVTGIPAETLDSGPRGTAP